MPNEGEIKPLFAPGADAASRAAQVRGRQRQRIIAAGALTLLAAKSLCQYTFERRAMLATFALCFAPQCCSVSIKQPPIHHAREIITKVPHTVFR